MGVIRVLKIRDIAWAELLKITFVQAHLLLKATIVVSLVIIQALSVLKRSKAPPLPRVISKEMQAVKVIQTMPLSNKCLEGRRH